MTAPMPPCPVWCASHIEHPAYGPNPPFALHRTAPVAIHTSDADAEVSIHCERFDLPGQPGTAQPFLRVDGVDHGLTVEQAWVLSGQAIQAAWNAELPSPPVTGSRERPDGAS